MNVTLTHPARRRARLTAALLVPLLLTGTAACSKDDASSKDPADALAAAKKTLDETSGVTVRLSTDTLPKGVDGVVDATGVGTHAPAFEGDVKLLVNSLSVSVPVVAVDGLVYAQLPFTTKYAEIDPADYGAPDPAQFMATSGGISGWLTAATGVKAGKKTRDGDTVLTSYTGTLSGKDVAEVIPSADKAADFPVTFRLDDQGRLDSADLKGPFYGPKGVVDYTVSISDYGTDKDITAP